MVHNRDEKAPVLSQRLSDQYAVLGRSAYMTLNGVMQKLFLGVLLVFLGGFIIWNAYADKLGAINAKEQKATLKGLLKVVTGAILLSFFLGVVVRFNVRSSAFILFPYAFLQGISLGALFLAFEIQENLPGLTLQALLLTGSIFGAIFSLCITGLLRISQSSIQVILTMGLAFALFRVLCFVLHFFGQVKFPEKIGIIGFSSSPLSIVMSLVMVAFASFILIINIQKAIEGTKNHLPKRMEWLYAFEILASVLLMCLRIFVLLAKSQRGRGSRRSC